MKRKQRKSVPWRRFGYVILIIIKFSELLLWFSPRIINALRSYIKHSKEYFIRYPNTLKLVKKTQLCLVFSTHFSVFGYLKKHSSSCLIYYEKNQCSQFGYWSLTTSSSQLHPAGKMELEVNSAQIQPTSRSIRMTTNNARQTFLKEPFYLFIFSLNTL